jgi:methylaspartate mutase epsilon subunit
MEPKIRNKRIDEDAFLKMREPVLAQWPTGTEVDLDEAVEYQKKLPDSKNMMKVTQQLHQVGKTVVFPRAGIALVEDSISLYRRLEETGVPYLPVTTDSYTRTLQFKKIEEALEETRRTGKTTLNGYPIINQSVKQTRRIIESVSTGAFDPRMSYKAQPLGSEIAFASGMTGMASGGFISWAPTRRTLPLRSRLSAASISAG